MRAHIYARQSFDRHKDELAVDRQLLRCREFCAERGWEVAAEHVDNDISATTGKTRPGFEQLLTSSPEVIVCWHSDRLNRTTRDLERVIELGVNVHALVAGHFDLSTPAGRAVARTVTAWSHYETEQKSLRQKAANRQRATAGEAGWQVRPFGFQRSGDRNRTVQVVEDEAELIRVAVDAVRRGESLHSIGAEWDQRGVPTTRGGKWSTMSVRRVLLNPRLIGVTTYRGLIMHDDGPSILDRATYGDLVMILQDPRRRRSPSNKVAHPLSGLILCGRCGQTMHASSVGAGQPIYKCMKQRGGCGMSRRREEIDQFVIGLIVARLGQPDVADLLNPPVDVAPMTAEAAELRQRRDGLAELAADGLLSIAAVREQAAGLTARIEALETEVNAAQGTSPLSPFVGARSAQEVWDGLPVKAQRGVIDTLLVLTIKPIGRGANRHGFDLDANLDWAWRQ